MITPYLARRLQRWEAAGLIDGTTREKILAWETEHGRGWATRGLLALGALILGVGLISLVAANWERIPPGLKLGADFLLLTVLAGAILRARPDGGARETLIFLFQLVCLASIGLIAQIYHLSGAPWRALALWSVIMLPVTLFARSSAPWSAWSSGLLAALGLWLNETAGGLSSTSLLLNGWLLAEGALLLHLLGLRLDHRPMVAAFGIWALALGLALTFGIDLLLHDGRKLPRLVPWLPVGYLLSLAVLALAAGRRLLRPGGLLILTLLLVMVGGVVTVLALDTNPPLLGSHRHGLAGALFSIGVLGLGLALSGLQGWRGPFRVFLVFLGLRIYGIYLEAFGGLAATGAGLVISGLVLIAVVLLMRRIQARFGRRS